MNQLSWLIYLGSVAGNFSIIFSLIAFAFLILTLLLMAVHFLYDGNYEEKDNARVRKQAKSWFITCMISTFFFTFTAALCPSKDTMYAIAASQMGEQALKTPTAIKAFQALNNWLDKQIDKPAS